MDRCLITVTHRTVEHNDPDAAGFIDGYWWTFTDEHVARGLVDAPESAAATRDEAEALARDAAEARGYNADTVDVQVADELLDREGDEERVAGLVEAWAS